MSIYKNVLGEQFDQLHPMLQKRYDAMGKRQIVGKGFMHSIQGGPRILYPIMKLGTKRNLLFPESGKSVPFTIINTPKQNGKQIHWERLFEFGQTRSFNALMSLESNRQVIKDYLGEPPLVYSDLVFQVNQGELTISSSKQRLILGKLEVPLPKWFQGQATVKERFNDETNRFEISVKVANPLIGQIFAYEGEFAIENLT